MKTKSRIVTLLTDFGDNIGYVGQMKGVLLTINPELNIVDLSHSVPPQNIKTAALILEQCHSYFPTGTLHMAVIDPGVGTSRPAVVVETDNALFIGPDNGLFGFLQKQRKLRRVFQLVNDRYFLENPSSTFEGRDVFSPVVAYLSMGYPIDEFGPQLDSLVILPSEGVSLENGELIGEIMAIDAFGNLITSLDAGDVDHYLFQNADKEVYAWCAERPIPIRSTFADVPAGEALAYIGSGDRLEIACNRSNAQQMLGVDIGIQIKLVVL